jgi:hypothetical protein
VYSSTKKELSLNLFYFFLCESSSWGKQLAIVGTNLYNIKKKKLLLRGCLEFDRESQNC